MLLLLLLLHFSLAHALTSPLRYKVRWDDNDVEYLDYDEIYDLLQVRARSAPPATATSYS